MKGKLINYLVIIGVSIILLLGIVTTAFGQDNSKLVDKFHDNCGKYGIPLHNIVDKNGTKSAGYRIGYLQPHMQVTKRELLSNNIDVLVIIKEEDNKEEDNKGDDKYQKFAIEQRFLDCPTMQNRREICTTKRDD